MIRTLKIKAPKEDGIHKIYWNMDEKGADRPSRKIRALKREPRGVQVKPGIYLLKLSFGNQTSTSEIKVEYDPRLEMPIDAINEIYDTSKSLEKDQQLIADVVKQLVESKNIALKFKKEFKKEDQKRYESQIKASSEIVKKIDELNLSVGLMFKVALLKNLFPPK